MSLSEDVSQLVVSVNTFMRMRDDRVADLEQRLAQAEERADQALAELSRIHQALTPERRRIVEKPLPRLRITTEITDETLNQHATSLEEKVRVIHAILLNFK